MAELVELGALEYGELIPPGQIGEDDLDAERIVEQLVHLIAAVGPGSAIGLFGSAGIGKTTIGERLKDKELSGRTEDGKTAPFTYVDIDASKYGGAGVRRRLMLKCAEKLGKNVGRVDRQLRGASSHSRYRLPNRPFALLVLLIPLILAVMVGIGLGIAALVDAVSSVEFNDVANDFVLAMLFAPAVAAGAFGLLARSLTTDWSLPAPSSDDEFVRIFEELFEGHDQRLLVFVDEIDRAPPERIADTLDGLRTFFGKGRCVFLVAADRPTLEHALSAWLGESTPEHAANPHYGAASAYLDKLFTYQLTVPPARTNALYQYARHTTSDLPGIWEELKANDALSRGVIDVLIPPHISSPRQVNVLLNGFAVTCHLLSLREPSMLSLERLREVAKLVCLRSEFPLFAADLHIDPRLPQFVLDEVGAKGPSPARAERSDRAAAYVKGLLPVSGVPLDGGAPADGKGGEVDRELRRQQSRQLIAYLARTKHVAGPSPDIIHGQAFRSELGAELAEPLSNAALALDRKTLDLTLDRIRREAKDDDAVVKSERDALDMLSLRARAREASDTANALRSLLHVVLACEDALDPDTAALVLSRIPSAREEAGTELKPEDHKALRLLERRAAENEAPRGAGGDIAADASSVPYS